LSGSDHESAKSKICSSFLSFGYSSTSLPFSYQLSVGNLKIIFQKLFFTFLQGKKL
jgi:hypothetical protein